MILVLHIFLAVYVIGYVTHWRYTGRHWMMHDTCADSLSSLVLGMIGTSLGCLVWPLVRASVYGRTHTKTWQGIEQSLYGETPQQKQERIESEHTVRAHEVGMPIS